MTAKDYPVTFGYGAKTTINGKPYTHRGQDRATPSGTEIVIAGTTIGLTGNTGLSTGPHLHTQAGTDLACQQTFNPSPLEFKEGTVVATGNGSQWGNYITMKVGSKYITYAHLSKINVKKGDIVAMYEGLTARAWHDKMVWYENKRKEALAQRDRLATDLEKLVAERNLLAGKIDKLATDLEKLVAERSLLAGEIDKRDEIIAELSKARESAPEAPQAPVVSEPVPDTPAPEKPQEDASTQAKSEIISWFTNLIAKIKNWRIK